MNRVWDRLKKQKRILAALVIVLAAACVELIANVHALKGGYDALDISRNITVIEEGGVEKYRVQFQAADGIYVRQIRLLGNFPENTIYRIKTKEINGFGKKEAGSYSDTVSSYFPEYSTNLGKKVTSLRITMKKTEGMELTGVALSNQFELNKFRVLFVLVLLSLLYAIGFEKAFVKNVEWYFVAFALSFGILLIALAQPMCNSWDEQIHFKRTYTIASGRTVKWSEAAQDIVERTNFRCNTKAEFAQLRAYMNEKGKHAVKQEERASMLISYKDVAYLPMALFLGIGKLLHLPFSMLFAFGKFGNLFLYVFVMFWAIRLAKSKKLFVAFIAMMPTSLFQACAYTYDAVVFSFLTLGCVLWCRETFFGEERMNVPGVLGAGCLFVFGCLSKAVYIPVVLLLLLLPQLQKRPRKEKAALGVGILVIFALVMLTFVLPVITNALAGNLSFGGDSRGGDTSAVRQLISMIRHPWESVKLMFRSVFALDNFRNLGDVESGNYFFGNLMLLSYSSMGTLGDKWCVLLLPVLTVLLFAQEPGNERIARCRAWEKVWMWGIFSVIVLLIWTALYLSFTPVGAMEIAGVQARYYLPLLYLFALLLTNTKIRVQIGTSAIVKLACVSACILQAAALSGLALGGRLL